LGHKSKIEDYLTNYSLCVHCGRGEAWGISINETMAAGIPTIVSEWTGAKDAVIKVDTKLICDITVESLYEKINWYFNLTKEMKIVLSNKSKSIASNYTEKAAINNFKLIFEELV
jgi:glycosyltransferase involved in cell wall biosynthesis